MLNKIFKYSLLLLPLALLAQENTIMKNLLAIDKGMEFGFYSGCKYDKDLKLDLSSCGYKPKQKEAVKLVPAYIVSPLKMLEADEKAKNAWEKGDKTCRKNGNSYKGIECAKKVSVKFKKMLSDLHNIRLASEELAKAKEGLEFYQFSTKNNEFGEIDFEIDHEKKLLCVRKGARGDIARTYEYMRSAYNISIDRKRRKIFEIWKVYDPIDMQELERNRRIKAIQGNYNPYISTK